MTIDVPEFDMVIYKYIEWIEDFAKRFEISRRLVAASCAKTEEERTEILNYSEAFAYIITVEHGNISFERIPASSSYEVESDCIYETFTMLQTLLPEQISASMGNAQQEIAELLKPRVKEIFVDMLGGVFS